MIKTTILGLILALGLVAAGCGSKASDNDAIRAAINSHLAGRSNLNVGAFDTEIQKVDIQGDDAKAEVAFHVKGGPGVMQLTYNLKKTGSTWAVVNSNPVGSNFTHPGADGNGAPGASGAPGNPADVMDAVRQKMAAPAPAK